jgi:hypothetical protein
MEEKFTNTSKDEFCVVSRREVFPFLRTLHLSSCGSSWTGVIRKSLGLEELKDFLGRKFDFLGRNCELKFWIEENKRDWRRKFLKRFLLILKKFCLDSKLNFASDACLKNVEKFRESFKQHLLSLNNFLRLQNPFKPRSNFTLP